MLLTDTLFLKTSSRTPIWLMRQAGRYLPEYRALREKAGGFLTMCYTPDLATEITLQPLRRFDLDAAIIFSDILVVPQALGQDLRFAEGEGPLLAPLRQPEDWAKLDPARATEFLEPVYAAIRQTRSAMPAQKALIGFCGAPWTLACYMVEGRGGAGFQTTLDAAKENPADFDVLIERLTDAILLHLQAQIDAGANAVQIFDSWAALCPLEKIDAWVIAPINKVTAALGKSHPHIPVIGFPRGLGENYARYIAETTVQGVGVDQGVDMAALAKTAARPACLQGNLAPEDLLAGGRIMTDKISDIVQGMRGRPFIFNLGHGVIKETPPEHVGLLIETVRGLSARAAA